MKNIHIPEPCHENWADFTPTQKGAFCHSCKIDVVDFSDKSPEQVKQILKENAGKHMCGRFKKSQLDELNEDFYAWENQSVKSLQSKFLYACLIVFGMSLFTSCNLNEKHVLGEIAMEWNTNKENAQLDPFTPAAVKPVEKDTTKKMVENELIKGKVKYTPVEEETNNCTPTSWVFKDTIPTEERHVKGEIAFIPEEEMLGNFIAPYESDDTLTNIISVDTLFDDVMIDGEISWTPEFDQFIEDTLVSRTPEDQSTIEKHSILTIENEEILSHFQSSIFPNPAKDQSTIVLQVSEEQIFNIYLYAINGKLVKTIYNGFLSTGRQEFVIDLTPYKAGSYLIMIQTNEQKASLQMEKLL
ncbi:MAG: T9SS type A sorting domain-containing protein [Crocinitomicaceae bacterium]|nr:T9SS type A sorting domain-containing protein [Crocinitomicaceae bacterium]